MCGGIYDGWDKPKQLQDVNGEPIVARTIRLLHDAKVKDISISTIHDGFDSFGVPVLRHDNSYHAHKYNDYEGYWCECFYITDEPTCYVFGDVVFSSDAIKTIVETEVDSIMLFGSKEPFAPEYPKWYIEPFAFKVQDTDRLKWAIEEVKRLDSTGAFHRRPIAWEVWNVICGTDPNAINNSYVAINDYTCDIDYPYEIDLIKRFVKQGGSAMATKKTETKAKPKQGTRKPRAKKQQADRVTYKGQTFTVLDRTDNRVMLTDGTMHFWVWAKDVKA